MAEGVGALAGGVGPPAEGGCRDAECDRFAADGAQPVQDPASLARECDIILTCLPSSTEVRQAIFGPGGLAEGLAPGKLIVDQTTGDPNRPAPWRPILRKRELA